MNFSSLKKIVCKSSIGFFRLSVFILVMFFSIALHADDANQNVISDTKHSFLKELFSPDRYELGGRFKNRISVSWPESDSFLQPVGIESLWDYSSNLRLTGQYFLNDWGEFEVHNETIYLASETRRKLIDLKKKEPTLISFLLDLNLEVNDRRRLMDLTWIIHEDDANLLINRFDRLSLALFPSWGVFRIGRQAITWGHGFLFNPMVIFTPFAPTQIDRDYKQGEDALSLQANMDDKYSDLQLIYVIYVPRRNVENHNIQFKESSLAGNYHYFIPGTESELTFIAGEHFDDTILGAGTVGYIGDAAWRFDTTWTYLDEGDDFFSIVTNIDYGWIWWGLNFYGWVEYYYNGLGVSSMEYAQALEKKTIIDRLDRGEIFVIGRHYLDTQIRVELHPLLNIYLIIINNITDPSGILQPSLIWDFRKIFS